MLLVFVLGSLALEVAETDGRPPLPSEEIRIEERLAALGAVDSAAFPRTAETATVAAGWVSSAQFRWGLEQILDGLASTSPDGARTAAESRPSEATGWPDSPQETDGLR